MEETTKTKEIWTPETITEWLEERIEFTNNFINHPNNQKINDNQHAQIVSDFVFAYENFRYCLKLYKERSDAENLRLFKSLATKILFDTMYEFDKQESRCISIQGVIFPTNEKKDNLPQEFWDNQKKWRSAFENLYNQIREL